MAVIKALANHHYGLKRNDLIQKAKLPNGRTASKVLEALVQSGFIDFHFCIWHC